MWDSEIRNRFAESAVRTPLAIHLVPYVVHACMAFGLWLATLRHKAATAQAHARQYAEGVVDAARMVLSFCPESLGAAAPRCRPILEKLGANGRTHAVTIGLERGIIEL